MKNYLLLILALTSFITHAQRKPRIKGSRILTEVRETLPDFHAVKLLDDLEISLEKSSGPAYELSLDDNLVNILKFEVVNDTLLVSSYYTITAKKKLEIRILYDQLDAITLVEGQLEMNEILNAESLSITALGLSKLSLHARASKVKVAMGEQSTADLNLEADSVELDLHDRADARIYQVGQQLSVSMFDNADARLEGTTGQLVVDLKDNADLKSERLEATDVQAVLDNQASAHIRATGQIELTSRGSANTNLYGDPRIVINEFKDTSQLTKRPE